MRFGVERKVLGRAFHPELRGLLIGDRVEGAVDLNDGKPGGVVTQAVLGRGRIRRIPTAFDQGWLRPGGNANLDSTHQRGRWAAGASLTSPRGLPGSASTSVLPITPASERDSIACGVLRNPAARMASAMPGTG